VQSVDDALAIYEESMNTKTNAINDLKKMFSGEDASQSSNEDDDDALPIQTMTLKITCRGVYSNLRGLISEFNELDNLAIVKEVVFAKEAESTTGVLANLTIDFPYYPDNSTYVLEAWEEIQLKGPNVDPFEYFIRGSVNDPNIPKTSTGQNYSSTSNPLQPAKAVSMVDFYVGARPKSSDDFAFTVGKKGDSAYRLSSDLSGEEIVLQIVDVNGKPAFKMGTKLRPITEETKATAFAPSASGKVLIEVLSQPRINENDILSGTLTVKNTSSLPVTIKVTDEDATSPRLTIFKEGNVTIK
jgi:hypothetical protein